MKKICLVMITAALLVGTVGCSSKNNDTGNQGGDDTGAAKTETLTGKADGYGGEVVVTLSREDGKIVDVKITGDKETEGVGTNAIDQLPEKIVAANGPEVDDVSGATVTSTAIKYAVNNALDPEQYPYPQAE